MRKTFLAATAALALSLALAACGDSSDDSPAGPANSSSSALHKTANVIYTVVLDSDVVAYFDAKVQWKDKDGSTQTFSFTNNPRVRQTLENVTLPFDAQLVLTYAKKEGVSYEEQKTLYSGYALDISYQYTPETPVFAGKTLSSSAFEGVPVSHFEDWRDKLVKRSHTVSSTIPQ
jgi:hypothetical protein